MILIYLAISKGITIGYLTFPLKNLVHGTHSTPDVPWFIMNANCVVPLAHLEW